MGAGTLFILAAVGALAFFMAGYYVHVLRMHNAEGREWARREAELLDQMAGLQERNERLGRELRLLREKVAAFENAIPDDQLKTVVVDSAPRLAAPAIDQDAGLELKLQAATRRREELEHYADEAVALRTQLRDKERIETELREAREHIRHLEALVFSAGLHIDEPPAPYTLKSRTADSALLMGAAMDDCLSIVTSSGKAKSMVVADEQGLLLSGSGDAAHHESLGVLACSLFELSNKAHALLPLGVTRSIGLIDQKGVLLAGRLFSYERERLAIVALSVGGQNPGSEIERSLKKLTRAMDAHNAG